jgi:hypothetical protein
LAAIGCRHIDKCSLQSGAFYKSPAGQATISNSPSIIQKLMKDFEAPKKQRAGGSA